MVPTHLPHNSCASNRDRCAATNHRAATNHCAASNHRASTNHVAARNHRATTNNIASPNNASGVSPLNDTASRVPLSNHWHCLVHIAGTLNELAIFLDNWRLNCLCHLALCVHIHLLHLILLHSNISIDCYHLCLWDFHKTLLNQILSHLLHTFSHLSGNCVNHFFSNLHLDVWYPM